MQSPIRHINFFCPPKMSLNAFTYAFRKHFYQYDWTIKVEIEHVPQRHPWDFAYGFKVNNDKDDALEREIESFIEGYQKGMLIAHSTPVVVRDREAFVCSVLYYGQDKKFLDLIKARWKSYINPNCPPTETFGQHLTFDDFIEGSAFDLSNNSNIVYVNVGDI